MRACIRRGASQIGGNLIELEAEGSRLVLDAGLPLELEGAPPRDLLPDVPGLWADSDGSLLALLISHAHPDHYGLADLVAPSVPIFIGEHAAAILNEAVFFVPGVRPFPLAGHLRHREPLSFGPFTVTPWLVDHSAFDARRGRWPAAPIHRRRARARSQAPDSRGPRPRSPRRGRPAP